MKFLLSFFLLLIPCAVFAEANNVCAKGNVYNDLACVQARKAGLEGRLKSAAAELSAADRSGAVAKEFKA